ncbi:MAG TPA: NAD-dependent epimerase/dehydratase family protein, partial [Bordetella sp.]|nr:NAD-dependent epimerase/dehydratase family protein [Bordetella sp.]
MAERVLLAGCGDLGLRLARRLRARGADVWALRRQPPADGGDGIQWLRADLTQPATLTDLPGGITHLAYLPAPGARDPAVYRAVFHAGLPALLAALDTRALQRVLFVSSSAVYGDHHGGWVDETTPPDPVGFNGRILLDTENWLAAQAVSSV